MKTKKHLLKLSAWVAGALVWCVSQLHAQTGATHYVNWNSTNATPPYTDWTTAATNIQDAVDASVASDTVLVTNGVYAAGGRVITGGLTNRVAVTNAITLQSVNGPWVTIIQGAGAANGASAVRCAWLTNNATLTGFTLELGATTSSDNKGGGVWCASSNAIVNNCVIVSNTAESLGSCAFQGTLNNCLISGGTGLIFAVYGANLNSCTVVSNSFGGVTQGTSTNCIVYYNTHNLSSVTAAYCCTTPLSSGPGNFNSAPQLASDGVHLSSASPCIGAGTNIVTGTDIFGRAWANPPSVGCAEIDPSPTVGQPKVTLTGTPIGFELGNATVGGRTPLAFMWLENGVPLQDNGHFSSTQTTNLVATGINFADAGNYQLVVSNFAEVVTSAVVQVVIHTVDVAGTNPTPPFLTWDTAATNIQDAINVAQAGEIVLVTNGIYATGGASMDGASTNRVVVNKAVTVVSVNGYTNTIIQGAWDPVSTNGPGAVRCAWLTNGAILGGFTLQNGATQKSGNAATAQSGGGAWCASTNSLVANCLLTDNSGINGGGIYFGILHNSIVINNVARNDGGGAYSVTLNNCLVVSNLAAYGGGANNSLLNNCTVVDNATTTIFQNQGAGLYSAFARNSIVVNNIDNNFLGLTDNFSTTPASTFSNCCTFTYSGPIPGAANITSDPQFLDLYHISTNSPCRGAGSALYTTGTDLDGEPWNNPPSMGCDEVVVSNRVGPLSVALNSYIIAYPPQTNALVNHAVGFVGTIAGSAASLSWTFGDGTTITNGDYSLSHVWTSAGDYNVVFTAYNADNPAGVSTNIFIQVVPIIPPQLLSLAISGTNIQFQFDGQVSANYVVQYATNLTPPVTWLTLDNFFFSSGNSYQITDAIATNGNRYYRVQAQ